MNCDEIINIITVEGFDAKAMWTSACLIVKVKIPNTSEEVAGLVPNDPKSYEAFAHHLIEKAKAKTPVTPE